jgi:hypothetical protein
MRGRLGNSQIDEAEFSWILTISKSLDGTRLKGNSGAAEYTRYEYPERLLPHWVCLAANNQSDGEKYFLLTNRTAPKRIPYLSIHPQ